MILGRETRTYREGSKDLQKIIETGRRHRQLGLYLYLLTKGSASFSNLYKIYNSFARHRVTPESLRHQLKLLERKGLARKSGDTYYPIQVPPEAIEGLFDIKRSRSGRIGAQRSLQHFLYNKYMEIPAVKDINPKLRKKIEEVLESTKVLVEQGKREAALDLLVHTFLPVRKTGILWCWFDDTFIYYERKIMSSGAFHSVRFPTLARLLKEWGFEEGIMCYHVLASNEARRWLRKIFGSEDTYPYARSVFYTLKKLGLAEEGPQYIFELQHIGNILQLLLKDIYGNTLQQFTTEWNKAPPPPLTQEGERKVYLTLGVQHVKVSNEGCYFTRF